jgi:serine/threonine protein kinase
MIDPQTLCLGCMQESVQDPCPLCGYYRATVPESPFYLSPGTMLQNQFLIGKVLGAGGFGITYIGYDLNLARRVAIKEYFPSGVAVRVTGMPEVFPHAAKLKADYQWGLERFLDEARIVARFHHMSNIIWVQNYFSANGTAYMVMEFLDGEDLEQILRRMGKLPIAAVQQVMTPVLEALKVVHADGLMHRDISPDNIYVTEQGEVIKLIDFGAARFSLGQQSKNLSVILKPGYAPPEQYESKGKQGPWTDVYACAATIYRALTNVVPPASYDRLSEDELVPPTQLGALLTQKQEEALLRAMQLRAESRQQSIADFQNDIFGYTAAAAMPAPVPEPPPQPAPQPILEPAPLPFPLPPPKPVLPPWSLISALGVLILVLAAVWLKSREEAEIQMFTVSPSEIRVGESAKLSWKVSGAKEVEISGLGKRGAEGQESVTATVDQTYVLRAGKNERNLKLLVAPKQTERPASALEIVSFTSSLEAIHPKSEATLSWEVRGASSVRISGTEVPAKGQSTIRPESTAIYELVASGAEGEERKATVTVAVTSGSNSQQDQRRTALRILRFSISPDAIRPGQTANVEWELSGEARRITLEPGGIVLSGSQGVRALKFQNSETLTLRAEGANGVVSQQASISVSALDRKPANELKIVSFDVRPKVMNGPRRVAVIWSVSGAQRIQIDPDPGPVNSPNGELMVDITQPTTFTISAYDASGQKISESVEVKAVSAPVGKDSWLVVHSHGFALPTNINVLFGRSGPVAVNPQRPGANDPCTGYLTLSAGRLRYQPMNNNDGFDVALVDLKEVKGNVLPIGNYKAFHVRLKSGKLYNFIPKENVGTIVDAIRGKM